MRDAAGKIIGANGLFAMDAPASRSMMLSYLEQEMSEAIRFANPGAKIEYQQGGGYLLSV